MFKYFLAVLLLTCLYCYGETNSNEFENSPQLNHSSKDLKKQYSDIEVDKLLQDLENYESYRPDSSSDTSRNPFHKKRYNFAIDKD
jgi:hypothetical protein